MLDPIQQHSLANKLLGMFLLSALFNKCLYQSKQRLAHDETDKGHYNFERDDEIMYIFSYHPHARFQSRVTGAVRDWQIRLRRKLMALAELASVTRASASFPLRTPAGRGITKRTWLASPVQ
jgi:hypothetical protein